MRPDFRAVGRALGGSPVSAGAAVLTLALTLGIGATLAALVEGVLLTPPPFADPDALMLVGETPLATADRSPRPVPLATLDTWRVRGAPLFAGLEAFDPTNLTLTGDAAAERVSATAATPGLLKLLGVPVARGRAFDDGDAGRPVVIVSDEFWRRTLFATPQPLGTTITLNGLPHIVIGVLPPVFCLR